MANHEPTRERRAAGAGRGPTAIPEPFAFDKRDSAFRRRVVEIANEVRPHLKGSFANVESALDDVPFAFAVWQNPAEPNGIDLMIVKGFNLLRDIVAEGEARPVTWTAIPCTCAEQAGGLRMVLEETERLH